MSRLGLADIAQRSITFCLFGITMYGAAIVVDGSTDIVRRRITTGPIGPIVQNSAPVTLNVESKTADANITDKK